MPQQTRDKMQAHWDRLRGVPRSEQVREKISSALTGKNKPRRVIEAMLKGQHPITEATREKLSAAKRNKRLPSAHVDSIRKSRTGKVWITDGLTTRSVGVSTVVPSGWRRGRTF